MKKITFTFKKLDFGGILVVKAASEDAARRKMKLKPSEWELLSPKEDNPIE